MTKGERKKAIALALARIEAAEIARDEAYSRLHEKEAELGKIQWIIYGAYLAEIRPYKNRVEECNNEYWNACYEYDELTKYKAWRNL